MAAYQCLNCHQIEHGEEDCCDKPNLFCINDMPSEILRLRELLRLAQLAADTENEHCAKVVESMGAKPEDFDHPGVYYALRDAVELIRKRSTPN